MDLMANVWHVFSSFFVFLFGLLLSLFLPKLFKINRKRSFLLYIWHTSWCLTYLWFVLNDGGDSLKYYSDSIHTGGSFLRVGTQWVVAFTSIFSDIFNFSILGVFLVFNIFGFIGLLAFAGALKAVTSHKGRQLRLLALIIILLPSVSFWSSAIGKDAISFMATGLALWAALNLQRRMVIMLFAVVAMFFVRPHMAGMMVIALSASFVLHANVSVLKRVFAGAISLGVAAFLIPFALQYAGVGETTDVDALMNYVEERQGYNQGGGGGVDIASMSLPMQLLTYMFRPIIFEARSIFQLAAAFDNIILLFLFAVGGIAIWKGRQSPVQDTRIFLWVYALLAWIVLSMTTANLGIAMRQKWMFAPMLIYLLISVMGKVRNLQPTPQALAKPKTSTAALDSPKPDVKTNHV